MDRESVDRLRFDRRLEHRRGWVEESAQDAHLESLPDVTEKMTRGLDEPEEGAGAVEPAGPEAAATTGYSAPDPASDPRRDPRREPTPGSFGAGGGSEPS